MVQLVKKSLTFLLFCIVVFGILVVNSSAMDSKAAVSSFSKADNGIICIAHRGDWHSFPENSAEAIGASSEYDMVSVDIQVTQDAQIILMADTTTDRMCVDSDGNTVSGAISSMKLSELGNLYLRQSNGGKDKSKTDCRISTLEQAYQASAGITALMLNVSLADFKATYDKVCELEKINDTVFRIDASSKKIVDAVSGLNPVPQVTGNYQGNIIFLATGSVKTCFENSINTVELGSANGHGVLYDNFMMKRFVGNGRAMVSMVDGRCGKRADNEEGWDDLISRGYSVIETDYPEQFSEYQQRTADASSELQSYVDLYESTDTSAFTTDTENAFKNAVSDARRKLSNPSSLNQLTDARYALQASFDNLTVGAKKSVTLSFSFSIGRIIAAVLCGAAVIASQIYLYKKRK